MRMRSGKRQRFKARARKNSNAINRAAVEAVYNIRACAKIQGAKRERSKADERDKVGDDIKEKT